MNEHASSSGSPPKTSTDADRSSDESASVPLEQELVAWGDGYQAWVDRNLQSLLKDFVTGKKSKIGVAMCPNTVTRCIAKEGTDENLRFILGKIYQKYGPIRMYYKGCDTLANHWVTGWETVTGAPDVQRVMICVEMSDRPPVSEKVAAMIKTNVEKFRQDVRDRVNWVDVPSDSVDDGDWIEPDGIRSTVKNIGRFLLDGLEALRRL